MLSAAAATVYPISVDTTAAVVRIGSFAGPTVGFGLPLQIVHPLDNKFPMFDPEIEVLNISIEEKAKLQAETERLAATLIVARDRDDD